MKTLFIYSKFAKKGKIENYLPIIKKELENDFDLHFAKTEYEKHASEIAKNACGNFELIIVAGGDGLVNEVLNGIKDESILPKIAVLPFGTVNDFAKSLGYGKNLSKNLKKFKSKNFENIDIMQFNNSVSSYVICSGKHSQSTYNTKHSAKRKLGWFAYFIEAVREVVSKNNYKFFVELDGKECDKTYEFIMFINSKRVAGFNLNKHANLNDSKFDVVLIEKRSGFMGSLSKYYNLVKMFMFGVKSLKNSKHATVKSVSSVKVYNINISNFNIDGECFENLNEIEIKVFKQPLQFLI